MKNRYVAIACALSIFVMAALPCLFCDSAKVQAVGITVFTVGATNITETTATLNGNLTSLGTSENVTVYFEWGNTPAYGNETTPQPKTAPGTFSASISGLSPNAAYHFRAKAVGDEIIYGSNIVFFTITGGVPDVTTNAATSITDTTAVLNGNLTDTGTSDNVTVRFQWGTSATYGFFTDTQLMTTTGTFSASLSGLLPDITYHFRTAAYGDGTSYGEDKTFTTQAGPVSLTVTTGGATGITPTGATLNGTLTDLGTSDEVSVSFEWGTTTSYGNATTAKKMSATGSFNAALSDLSPGATYHFRAKAVGDKTSYGEDRTLKMGADTPSVTTSAATDITTSSATLNGDLTALGSATKVTTSFEWGTTQGGPYPNQTTTVTMTAVGTLDTSLKDLDPDTTYYFRSKAVGDGTSYGSELSFTTELEPAAVPASTEAISIFEELNWTIIAAVAGGVVLLIVLSIVLSRPRTRPAGRTQQWAKPGGIQQQTPGTQQWAQQDGTQQKTPGTQQGYQCPTCGANISFGINPCPSCGTTLNWGTQQMSTCPVCGANIPFGANPCPICGTGLDWY